MTDVAESKNALPGDSDFVPRQEDLIMNLPPSFDTADEERTHRKQQLAGALRVFGKFGFAEGVAGHITARDPELLDHFWVNPFGKSFRQMSASDLILVGPDGSVVHGNRPVNTAAFAIHSAIHEARPDVVAAAHSHSIFGKTFSSLGVPLKMITQDHCMFYNDVVLHADGGGGIVNDVAGGEGLARTLGDKKAVIHQNHGLITAGGSVASAAFWFIALERCCQSQLVADAAGTPLIVEHEAAQYTYDQSGHDLAGWFQFQPIWDDIVAEAPELLD